MFKQPLVNKKRISFLLNSPGCFYKLVAEINVHQTMFFFHWLRRKTSVVFQVMQRTRLLLAPEESKFM